MQRTPTGLPVLARGRHRSPRRGACLMEYTSLLAGKAWSDSPACTHPALAALARAVNDCTSDQARQQLLELAPLLAGAPGPAPTGRRGAALPDTLGPRLARTALLRALAVTTGVRRRTLLVALLGADAACPPTSCPEALAVQCLLSEPDLDVRSAVNFIAGISAPRTYHLRGITTGLHLAVRAIVDGAGPPADDLLRGLLVDAVHQARLSTVVVPAAAPVAGR